MKSITQLIAKKTLPLQEQQDKFIDSISNSKDIKSLLIDNNVMSNLDDIEGFPKLILTIFSRYN
jgi:3-methyladenine DNA glycosylase AlkC